MPKRVDSLNLGIGNPESTPHGQWLVLREQLNRFAIVNRFASVKIRFDNDKISVENFNENTTSKGLFQ